MTDGQGGADQPRPAVSTSTDEWLSRISGQLDMLIGGGASTAPPAQTPPIGSPDHQVAAKKRATSKRTTVRGT